MVTIRTWTVHHGMYQGECVRCGWRDEYHDWPLGTVGREVMDKMREECTSIVEETR